MIRDHLSERLERDEPSRWAELHRKAAQLFAASDLERAVSHALAAAAYDLALDLIESRLDQTATADYVEGSMLVRWLEAVPDEAIRQRPVLCARAIMSARFSRRDDLYERWSAVRPVMQPETVEVCLVEADAADSAGDASRMRSAALAGLALCEPSSRWALDFHSALAHAEELLGSWEAAADSLRRLRRSPGITPPAGLPAQETIHAALVVDLARAGDFVSSQRARAELATWLADAEASGYTTVGLGSGRTR